ncbi:MAG: hypothetical protein HN509_01230 [Halobacteriovoraceae bacterium]|jgi:hypothetical protein|nr:hypothetical protein [Halobacteriovoraceae bacterium]MBT5094187.1 hypothetical protein [Halobacteriovoraceae bacterium]
MGHPINIDITFCHYQNHEETLELSWELMPHLGALVWLKCLKKIMDSNTDLEARFAGFRHGYITMDYLGENINKCVDLINEDGRHHIKERYEGKFSQEFSNAIHHHFEVLVGPAWQPTEFYLKSPQDVKRAILGLNQYIHDMEGMDRAIATAEDCPDRVHTSVHVEFLKKVRYEIPDEAYDYFTINPKFGDIVLHYAQIGKSLLEIYLDQDEDVEEGGIQPLRSVTGEFDIFFSGLSMDSNFEKDFHNSLRENGYDPEDKKLALGFLPVAKFCPKGEKSVSQFQEEFSQFLGMRKIKIRQGQTELLAKEFEVIPLDFEKRFHNYG